MTGSLKLPRRTPDGPSAVIALGDGPSLPASVADGPGHASSVTASVVEERDEPQVLKAPALAVEHPPVAVEGPHGVASVAERSREGAHPDGDGVGGEDRRSERAT